ncbi:protein NEOXANTHIN-DEFICIENT 1 isoform X1 [Physcomitrium patens]|uniref:protein NEOXANTHIN-DEFICIENT 1 isoform X1 n=1 Tax=Physcomitrium patens TaxID=3218 RepID=UPI000D169620|nr:protein NEOXANTHIN-DEFICIENT 1-like isoform X1 [Physcomitrium patens]|eukprot:XP_024393751.1 protein NEOXANTHIN-DEFICIENT 1-like isoform X1 [Physcomitrella patens]
MQWMLLKQAVLGIQDKGWACPSMKMSLHSFSGKTKQQPDLKSTCRLNCRIRPVFPARVSPLQLTAEEEPRSTETQDLDTDLMSVLRGKATVALPFENMAMCVDASTVVLGRQEPAKVKEAHGLFSWFPRFKSPSVLAPST